MKIVTEADFLVSDWSGGKTTQLFIFPEGTTLAGRDFDWRISSAVIQTEESDFSPFDGYERILIPLEGKLEMEHQTPNGVIRQNVNQFELARFSGSWPTKGKGKLTDFNLIFKPNYHPKVQISYFKKETRASLQEPTMVLYLLTGSVGINDQLIQAPVLILNNEHQKIEITYFAESRVIFIEMNLVG